MIVLGVLGIGSFNLVDPHQKNEFLALSGIGILQFQN